MFSFSRLHHCVRAHIHTGGVELETIELMPRGNDIGLLACLLARTPAPSIDASDLMRLHCTAPYRVYCTVVLTKLINM